MLNNNCGDDSSSTDILLSLLTNQKNVAKDIIPNMPKMITYANIPLPIISFNLLIFVINFLSSNI